MFYPLITVLFTDYFNNEMNFIWKGKYLTVSRQKMTVLSDGIEAQTNMVKGYLILYKTITAPLYQFFSTFTPNLPV